MDNFKLPYEESSEKRVLSSLSLLEREYRPCRGGNSEQLLDLSTVWYHERESFFREFGSAHAASAEDNEP